MFHLSIASNSYPSIFLRLFVILINFIPEVWNGFACLSNPCIHGVCLDDLNSTYFCYCIDGYTGIQCQTNWNECWSSPCRNGGICVDGIASFNCTCPPGFVGDFCEQDFNECESNPCWNNGTCIDGPNGYNCQCSPGYSGVHCEMDIAVCNMTDEARCYNGGICMEGPGESFSCKCQPGWGGFLCDREINECMSAPCQNGAVCIDLHADYSCACLFGYSGKNCEEVVQICGKNPCKNGALCLIEDNHTVCYCVPDYHGELCQYQYDECQLGSRCLNGGTCIDGVDNFTCSCPANFTGSLCDCLILPNNKLDCNYQATTTTRNPCLNFTTPTTTRFTEENSFSTIGTTKKAVSSTTYTTAFAEKGSTDWETSTLFFTELTTEAEEKPTLFPEIDSTTTLTTDSFEENTTSIGSETSSVESTTHFIETTTEVPNITALITISPSSERTDTTTPETIFTSTFKEITSTDFTTESTTLFVPTFTPLESNVTFQMTEIVNFTSTTNDEVSQTFETGGSSLITTVFYSTSQYPNTTISTILTDVTESTSISTTTYSVPEESSSLFSVPSTTFEGTTSPAEAEITEEISTTESSITSQESATVTTQTKPASTTEELLASATAEQLSTSTESLETNRSFPETKTTPVSTFLTEETFTELTEFSTLTTFLQTSTDVTTFIDCTSLETRCQNGGTCIFTGDGHKCICPFDAEGPYCEIKLGIRNAAFNGNSYLIHHITPVSNITIEFISKTLSNNGLFFYLIYGDSNMALYVENGFLVFKFSCGYQTMLLSERKVPVNNGADLNIKASLEFTNDFKHCDANIKANDSLSMRGDQVAKIAKFSRHSAELYLGGIPNEIYLDNVPTQGFVGCMSQLKILGEKVQIYKDAETGHEVTECSSLACLSNPCRNGASCTSNGEAWVCHCRNGYLGKMCEFSTCDNNPCLFGGTCIPFSNSGYICLCPYGKHGHFCENDLKVSEPYFSSSIRGLSSFLAYELPEGVSQKMDISFRFSPTTMEQISILLFMGQNNIHDFYSDHLSVSFVKGYIMLTWNMGSGPRRIFTSQPVEKGARDYLVKLGYSGRRAWLFVENLGNVTGRSPGNSIELNVTPFLYLGGHESQNFSILPHDLPYHTGFSGCIFDLEIKSGNIAIPLRSSFNAVGRAVGQCGTTECYERSCQNGGACLHHGSTFMCLCQDNWFGPLCSVRHNLCDKNFSKCAENSRCVPLLTDYECDCPFGRIGQHCQIEQYMTDIGFTGKRSYLVLNAVDFDNTNINIEMEIRILSLRGVILYVGKKENSFICLSLADGLLELKIHSGTTRQNIKDPLTVRSSKLLLKGVWHKIQFGVYGRKVYLHVDHTINVGVLDHGFVLSIQRENIFLGGLPDLSKLPFSAVSINPVPFSGCLRLLTLDGRGVPLDSTNIQSSRNVVDCDGTPCGGESCFNGGTCWLDSFQKPHCVCVEPYYGEKCEKIPPCNDKSCKNYGICRNSTCHCKIGFDGGFCEAEIQVKTPAFTGQSYLIIKKLGEKKRNLGEISVNKLLVNFTTVKTNGLLVFSKNDPNFFGLGLENGFIKLAFKLKTSQKLIIEVPSYFKVADGLWHTIEINFAPLTIHVDNKPLQLNFKGKNGFDDSQILSNGVFYIGGMPTNFSLLHETHGIFPYYFEGCIQGFATNDKKIVSDFTPFEGSNINSCRVL